MATITGAFKVQSEHSAGAVTVSVVLQVASESSVIVILRSPPVIGNGPNGHERYYRPALAVNRPPVIE